MEFKVTILGNTSATPTRERDPSGQYLNLGAYSILIDCSEGIQSRILRYNLNYSKIRYIFISHLHGDHFLGLPPLLNTMGLHRREKPITIVAPKGLRKVLETIWETTGVTFQFHLEIIELDEEKDYSFSYDGFDVVAFPLKHRIPCFGFTFTEKATSRKLNIDRCRHFGIHYSYYNAIKQGQDYVKENGKVIPNKELTLDGPEPRKYAYITDTLPLDSVVPYIKNSNLLYHESTFLDVLRPRAEETFHSTTRQAASVASKAAVNQLLIGHFSSRYSELSHLLDEAKEIFQNCRIAEQGKTFQIE